jgi:hypothetical protein
LFDRTGALDDNILLVAGPDPGQMIAGDFSERFASYPFHYQHGREGQQGHIILTPTFCY